MAKRKSKTLFEMVYESMGLVCRAIYDSGLRVDLVDAEHGLRVTLQKPTEKAVARAKAKEARNCRRFESFVKAVRDGLCSDNAAKAKKRGRGKRARS